MRERQIQMNAQLAKLRQRDTEMTKREESVQAQLTEVTHANGVRRPWSQPLLHVVPSFPQRLNSEPHTAPQANRKLGKASQASSHRLKIASMKAENAQLKSEVHRCSAHNQ